MVTRRSRTTATLVGTALVLAATILVVRHFTTPRSPSFRPSPRPSARWSRRPPAPAPR
ncbi:hypothetical protein SAZ11_40455 [Streptomyces sp. FXJ1.4098]|nr:hypothetical protein [Streptomyces sp. FXJ1.4098]